MEFFDLTIIVSATKVLLLKVLLEPLPDDLSFADLISLFEVFPPKWGSAIQIEYGDSGLHVSIVIMNLEILPYPKKPSLSFLPGFDLTVKSRWFDFPEFSLKVISIRPLSLFLPMIFLPMIRRSRTAQWISRGRWFTVQECWWCRCIITGGPSFGTVGPLASMTPGAIPGPTSMIVWILSIMHLSLYVYQTLQHGSLQLVLFFLRFDQHFIICSAALKFYCQAPHGFCNIGRGLFICLSIGLSFWIDPIQVLTYDVCFMLIRALCIFHDNTWLSPTRLSLCHLDWTVGTVHNPLA